MNAGVKGEMPLAQDNKLIDLVGAVVSGAAISVFNFLGHQEPSKVGSIKFLVINIAAFSIVAFIFFLWKARLRVKVGWLLIAVFGSIIAAIIFVLGEGAPDHNDPDTLGFLTEELLIGGVSFVFYLIVTSPIMAAVHYLGLTLRKKGYNII